MKSLELLATIALPWILDLLLGHSVMASTMGSLLWGVGLLIVILRRRIKDPKLASMLGLALAVVSGAWLMLWGISASEGINYSWERSKLLTLYWVHGSLLAAGFGAVLVALFSNLAWLTKDSLLRSPSSKGRRGKWGLPSLEALDRSYQIASHFSVRFWGMGTFLAMVTAVIRWQSTHPESASSQAFLSLDWLLERTILGTFALWALLLLSNWFEKKPMLSKILRYRVGLALALVFILSFVWVTGSLEGPTLGIHGKLRWWTR